MLQIVVFRIELSVRIKLLLLIHVWLVVDRRHLGLLVDDFHHLALSLLLPLLIALNQNLIAQVPADYLQILLIDSQDEFVDQVGILDVMDHVRLQVDLVRQLLHRRFERLNLTADGLELCVLDIDPGPEHLVRLL